MLIIAEIGLNHNGNLDIAKCLVKEAKDCGADIAKFQFFDASEYFTPDFFSIYLHSAFTHKYV